MQKQVIYVYVYFLLVRVDYYDIWLDQSRIDNGLGLWCLTPLSTIFQSYWWRKPDVSISQWRIDVFLYSSKIVFV